VVEPMIYDERVSGKMVNHWDVPVLVVGGGPVGLALAGDLGWRGVRCLLVERTDGTIVQPKMDMVGVRTMEFCRRWGIVEWVEQSPYPLDYPQDNAYVTSVTGYELGRHPVPSYAQAPVSSQSPQKRHRCPQDMFDPILRRFASSFSGVALEYETEVVSIAETPDGVHVRLKDLRTGAERSVTAGFVVGCDGAASYVRDNALGATMIGKGTLTYTTNLIFRSAELPALHDKGLLYRFIILGEEGTWATLVAINGADRWRMSIIGDGDPHLHSDAEIHAAIRRAVGTDFSYELLSVVPWIRRELVADSYRQSRLFIGGDAAHVTSPTGGFGMNMGIGDAVDLAWKLDAVLAGWGGPGLLASYQAERRPVALRNVSEASDNLARMLSPRLDPPGPRLTDPSPEGDVLRADLGRRFSQAIAREWTTIGIHLGYRYDDSPVICPDGSPAEPMEVTSYTQTARPGARAPHVWLGDGSSTLDLFGRGFVLLSLGDREDQPGRLVAAAAAAGVPLRTVHLSEPAVLEAYGRRLVLVRPDGHVAWRADDDPDDAAAVIDRVRGAVLRP
jgi:2-polyprenyl-6-methoxyphenol hydroxylase-like FAD-dependent oxidoreductase